MVDQAIRLTEEERAVLDALQKARQWFIAAGPDVALQGVFNRAIQEAEDAVYKNAKQRLEKRPAWVKPWRKWPPVGPTEFHDKS